MASQSYGGAQRDFSHRKSYSGNWGGACDWGPANQSITFPWSQWLAQEWSNQSQGDYFPGTLVEDAGFLLCQASFLKKIKPRYARGNVWIKNPSSRNQNQENGEKRSSVMTFQTLRAAMSEIYVNLWMILLRETIKSPFPFDRVPTPELQSHHLQWKLSWCRGRPWNGKGSGASVAVRQTSVHPVRPNENVTIFVQPSNHSSLHSKLLLPLFLEHLGSHTALLYSFLCWNCFCYDAVNNLPEYYSFWNFQSLGKGLA